MSLSLNELSFENPLNYYKYQDLQNVNKYTCILFTIEIR